MNLSEAEIQLILKLLEAEFGLGYSTETFAGVEIEKLQAKLSVLLEVEMRVRRRISG